MHCTPPLMQLHEYCICEKGFTLLHLVNAAVKSLKILHDFIKGRCLFHHHIRNGIFIIIFPIFACRSFWYNL